jgi:hypothetical protein
MRSRDPVSRYRDDVRRPAAFRDGADSGNQGRDEGEAARGLSKNLDSHPSRWPERLSLRKVLTGQLVLYLMVNPRVCLMIVR